jgi:hypothetical protein
MPWKASNASRPGCGATPMCWISSGGYARTMRHSAPMLQGLDSMGWISTACTPLSRPPSRWSAHGCLKCAHLLVQYAYTPRGNGPHRQLFVPRYPELTDEKDIKWGVEGLGHLKGHRHPTAQQCEHQDLRSIGIGLELFGELLPGVAPVPEIAPLIPASAALPLSMLPAGR